MCLGRECTKRNDISKGEMIMSVSVTLTFDYPWNDENMDENDIVSSLMELSPDELLTAANNAGEPVNVDVEVY